MEQTLCPICQHPALYPSARLITEICGHVKCRHCFISESNGCQQCLTIQLIPSSSSEPAKIDSINVLAINENHENFLDFESDSGELCIDTEVDDSTTFDGPSTQKLTETHLSILSKNAEHVDAIDNYDGSLGGSLETLKNTNECAENLKILEEFIIAPKSKIEKMFREVNDTVEIDTKCMKRSLERRTVLPGHIVRISENGESCYKCNNCGKKFRSRNQQYYHVNCGNDENKPYKCRVCEKNFSTSSHLNYHLKTHNDSTKYSCNICTKSFVRSMSLKTHKRIHEGNYRYRCKECGAAFNEKKSFTAHVNKHRNILPFACKICGKKFSFKSNLTMHKKIHTGLGKRFRCDECGKEFLRKNSFKEHLARHNKVKKFQCKLCQALFIDRKTLERHMNTHGSKVYKCPCCEVKCGRKDNLVRHIRNMHPNDDLPDILKNIKSIIIADKTNLQTNDKPKDAVPADISIRSPAPNINQPENLNNKDTQQQIVASTSVIRSIGNVKPVHIPNDNELQLNTKTIEPTEQIERLNVANHIDANKTGKTNNQESPSQSTPNIAPETKKPKKKYDPCEIYRKILIANDPDDSVLESDEFYSHNSKDDHIGCCDLDSDPIIGVSTAGGSVVDNRVDVGKSDNSEPSNFAEVHWRKSFYASL